MATRQSGFSLEKDTMIGRLPSCAVLLLATLLLRGPAIVGAETVVSLQFDDGSSSQYQVRSLLLGHGMRATFFVNSTRLGSNGYMTVAQLHDLQGDGHEIGGHTLDHVDLTTLSAAEAERQVCQDRAALIANGFEVGSFAYPFGAYNAGVEAIVAGCGYESARGIGGIGGCASCPSAETIPPADAYGTRTRASVKQDTTLATLQGWVTAAEAQGGGWVQIVMHQVCGGSGCSVYSVSPSTLAAFLDWLAPRAASGTVVKTVREVIGQSSPPPPPPDTTPPETSIACSPRGCSEWSDGPVTVTLSATDAGSGVAGIRYTTDGSDPAGPAGVSCGTNPCSFTVSTTATVKYQALDLAGNVEAVKSQEIRIDTQAPSVAITSPGNPSIVRNTVTVTASASDDVGVFEVRFYVDGNLIGADRDAPYEVEWQTQISQIGAHTLHAEADDLAGNVARSTNVIVVVGL